MFNNANTTLTTPFVLINGVQNVTPTQNILYLMPIYPPTTRTYTQARVRVNSPGGGGTMNIGIYNATSGNQPSTVLATLGQITFSSVGINTLSFSQSLDAKLYFLAYWCTGTCSSQGFLTSGNLFTTLGIHDDGTQWDWMMQMLQYSKTYSTTFPDLTSDSTYAVTQPTSIPLIGIR
jgi:hypothetical protein